MKKLIRVGHGFDAHRLVEGLVLVLGGVEIHYHQGLQGHSDSDDLIHAICDALLGASGFLSYFLFPRISNSYNLVLQPDLNVISLILG